LPPHECDIAQHTGCEWKSPSSDYGSTATTAHGERDEDEHRWAILFAFEGIYGKPSPFANSYSPMTVLFSCCNRTPHRTTAERLIIFQTSSKCRRKKSQNWVMHFQSKEIESYNVENSKC